MLGFGKFYTKTAFSLTFYLQYFHYVFLKTKLVQTCTKSECQHEDKYDHLGSDISPLTCKHVQVDGNDNLQSQVSPPPQKKY